MTPTEAFPAGSLVYADTSALLKLLVEEPESAALAEHVAAWAPVFASSELTLTELARSASRAGVVASAVDLLLDRLELLALDAPLLRRAGRLPGAFLRSADAIHVVSALDLGAGHFLTYDVRQGTAAAAAGLAVLAPGRA